MKTIKHNPKQIKAAPLDYAQTAQLKAAKSEARTLRNLKRKPTKRHWCGL